MPPPPGYAPGGYGVPAAGAADAFGRPLAEWWQRVAAVIIDGLILFIPTAVAVAALGQSAMGGWLAVLGVPTVYYALLNGGPNGQTVGKKVLGIQVRDAAGGVGIGPGRAAIRYLVVGVGSMITIGLFGLLDGLWPLWDPRRQALHDKVAQSLVVKVLATGSGYSRGYSRGNGPGYGPDDGPGPSHRYE